MFLDFTATSSDTVFSILQHSDIFELGRLCSLNKSFNTMLRETVRGRQLWLKLGIDATCGANGFRREDVERIFENIHGKCEFFWNLRLLVCPWHAEEVVLPIQRRVIEDYCSDIYISEDNSRIFLREREGLAQISFPSRPCSSVVEFMEKTVPNDTSVIDSLIGVQSCVADAALSLKVSKHEIVPDLSHDRESVHHYFQLHETVYVVIEKIANSFGFDHVVDDGFYFMSRKTGRMLKHIKCGLLKAPQEGFVIISRPAELWILTDDGVKYFGNTCVPRSNSFAEKMDPSLWMIAKGDVSGAIQHMRSIGAPLETPSLISNRTLLHYAAMEGHSNAVSVLINEAKEEGIDDLDVDALDDCSHSPLYMAVAELHAGVVKVLLEEGDADCLAGIGEGEAILSGIGSFVMYRPYNLDSARIKNEISNLVPSIMRLMIQKHRDVVDSYSFVFNDSCILSCPDAVRMLLAAGSDCFEGCNHVASTFGQFRSRAHELSAVYSFYVMVREFGQDINFVDGEIAERAVVTLAMNGIAESVIMLIEHLGADPQSTDMQGRSIRDIAAMRALSPGDVDGKRILSFLDSRGL